MEISIKEETFMFFLFELKRLRQLKNALLCRYQHEKALAALPAQLESRIAACEALAAIKVAEENLENEKRWDAENRKKRLKKATVTVAIISFVVTLAAALLLSLTIIPAAIAVVGGTLILTLLVRLIAKSAIKNGPAKNQAEILACEEVIALAKENYEAEKARIEAEIEAEIAYHDDILNNPVTGINVMIQNSTVVHDADKNYKTVYQIIWCFEHKYAFSVKEAKQWIERAKHSRYVRQRLDKLNLSPCDEQHIETNANEGKDFSAEIPEAED